MIALSFIGAIKLAITLGTGWNWYPFIGRAYRHGKNPDMFWFAVVCEIALIVIGIVGHFSK
jgi:hypothetical protein